MGGKNPSKLVPVYCCRANVLFVLNLTHGSGIVQFVSVQNREISVTALSICRIRYHQSQIKLSKQRVYAAI
jgi:hypothetical protein